MRNALLHKPTDRLSPPLRVIYVGATDHYANAFRRAQALHKLGAEVVAIPKFPDKSRRLARLTVRVLHHAGYPPDLTGANRRVLEAAATGEYGILWVEQGGTLFARTLREAKRLCPELVRVHYCSDDCFGVCRAAFRSYRATIPHYDLHFVPIDENIPQYLAAGARGVVRLRRGFCPDVHRPMGLTDQERKRLGSEVAFIGHWEQKRERDLAALIAAGIPTRVFGKPRHWRRGRFWKLIRPHFEPREVWGDDYARALSACKIGLCFLSKWNKDLANSRMFEIPACGAFMLCERNKENVRVFEEGREAEFFGTPEELVEKARHYLAHPDERKRIAAAGYVRCHRSGYDYASRMKWMLEQISQRCGSLNLAGNACNGGHRQ